jgi:threonyl-tRNA synthetase
LPVTERHQGAADALVAEVRSVGVRAESSGSQETLGKRVREAEVERIPYVLVVGDAEASGESVTVRVRGRKGQEARPKAEFLKTLREKIQTRAFDP